MLQGGCFIDHAGAPAELFSYIKGYDNTRRLHSSLNYRSPASFEAFLHSIHSYNQSRFQSSFPWHFVVYQMKRFPLPTTSIAFVIAGILCFGIYAYKANRSAGLRQESAPDGPLISVKAGRSDELRSANSSEDPQANPDVLDGLKDEEIKTFLLASDLQGIFKITPEENKRIAQQFAVAFRELKAHEARTVKQTRQSKGASRFVLPGDSVFASLARAKLNTETKKILGQERFQAFSYHLEKTVDNALSGLGSYDRQVNFYYQNNPDQKIKCEEVSIEPGQPRRFYSYYVDDLPERYRHLFSIQSER